MKATLAIFVAIFATACFSRPCWQSWQPSEKEEEKKVLIIGNLRGNVLGNLGTWQSSRKYEGCQHCQYLDVETGGPGEKT